MTESELRSVIIRSREDGFHALFHEYKKYVYAIVWEKLGGIGSREDAEECVSDIFTEIFLHFNEIGEGTLQGYIATVAKRRAINSYYRLRNHESVQSLDDASMPDVPSAETPEDTHEKNDLHRLLLAKIRQLGEPDATIVMQRYYYNCKTSEIARNIHLNPANVSVRLNLALKRLKKMLLDEGISM